MALLGTLRDRLRGEPDDGATSDSPTGDSAATNGPIPARVHAHRDEPFVVFLIGMRVNALWKVHRWLPIFFVAPRMIRELRDDPDSGLLGSRTAVGPGLRHVQFVQYWRSFEDLRAYARDSEHLHLEAWREYNASPTNEHSDVGIWHETYLVDPDDYETVYNNIPPHGLGAADGSELVPATGQRRSAATRLGRAESDESNGESGS